VSHIVGARASRRRVVQWTAAAGAAIALAGARSGRGGAQEADWTAEQAREIVTYGMPDDWANYGEVFKAFQASLGIDDGTHVDTDMSSLEEITKFDAEQANPVAMFADIGLLWGSVASERGVVPPYLPPLAEDLPDGYKGAEGGWVATFAGVPAIVVNTDAAGTEIATWDDLLKPELTGRVGSPGDPRTSGTAQTTFLAWAYAHGGSAEDLAPGVDFAQQVIRQYNSAESTVDLLERGEIACWMRYDFNCLAAVDQLAEKGINAEVVIPGVSIYAPSALMVNGYNTAKMDAAKLFMEYVLSDEAAEIFARFGARPIRYVLGTQELPEEARANWLPEEQYADVRVVENFTALDATDIATAWEDEVLGG
jgi:putative spermidine/putrescine transport system substrate-binding protein